MTPTEFGRQVSHADVLLAQGRYQRAEEILERLLATGYEDNDLFRMMAVAKMGLKKDGQAEELCRMIIARAPNEAFAFYLLSTIRGRERNFAEAINNLDDAIKLDPTNTNFHAFKANLLLQTKDYADALSAANVSISLDAENIDGLNARASALIGLNRKAEAFETIEKSLATDPNNADTHANMGWGLLHRGLSDQALTHFKAALKEEPLNEYAKEGMLEAMKAKFPVYRYFLMLMLWLGRLKGNNQWAVIIGGYILYRILFSLAESYEALQPVLFPVIGLMVLFFISSWIFSPLMNLYLLTNAYGKFTLSDHQKSSARWVGVALLTSVLSLIFYLLFDNQGLLSFAFFAFAMMIPLGTMFNPISKSGRQKLVWVTIVIAIFVILDSILAISNGTFMSSILFLPILSLVAYQWFANYLIISE
jgi:tetratricopeptide (TPR) repeat protein